MQRGRDEQQGNSRLVRMLARRKQAAVCSPARLSCVAHVCRPSAIVENFDYGLRLRRSRNNLKLPVRSSRSCDHLRKEPPRCASCLTRMFRSASALSCLARSPHHLRAALARSVENGELLTSPSISGFELLVTSDQNIRYQQNLAGRKIGLVVRGSNIWPVVRTSGAAISAELSTPHKPGSLPLHKMPLPSKLR